MFDSSRSSVFPNLFRISGARIDVRLLSLLANLVDCLNNIVCLGPKSVVLLVLLLTYDLCLILLFIDMPSLLRRDTLASSVGFSRPRLFCSGEVELEPDDMAGCESFCVDFFSPSFLVLNVNLPSLFSISMFSAVVYLVRFLFGDFDFFV